MVSAREERDLPRTAPSSCVHAQGASIVMMFAPDWRPPIASAALLLQREHVSGCAMGRPRRRVTWTAKASYERRVADGACGKLKHTGVSHTLLCVRRALRSLEMLHCLLY